MRNLYLVESEAVASSVTSITDALCFSLDQDSRTVFMASEDTLTAYCYESKEVVNKITLTSRNSSSLPIPVALQYLFDQQAVCIATQDGQLFLWNPNSDELECVGEVEHGLAAMSWSPDLELLIIITGNNNMILMSREFDPFTEISMFPEHTGEENPVSVGWGKKETQFHGSAGKGAAKIQTVNLEPAGPNDPGCPFVSWRGDGQFFVVSAIDPISGARSLYTWSRECMFQAKSEPVKGLQHSLFWKPSGSLIASVQHKGQGFSQDVIFFEKNGLRHGEFSLPKSSQDNFLVHRLMWNQDSSILALWINKPTKQGNIHEKDSTEVQLWVVNNYHWYLKQSLPFRCKLKAVEWDVEQANKLHVFTEEGAYLKYTWTWTIDKTSGSKADDMASVGVIDGDQLLMTPMRKTVVPPPMSAFHFSLPAPVNLVTFHPTSNDVAIILADETIAIFSYKELNQDEALKKKLAGGEGFKCQFEIPKQASTLRISEATASTYPMQRSHFLWIADTIMAYVTCDEHKECSLLHIADMNFDSGLLVSRRTNLLDSLVIGVALNETQTRVAIQTCTGEIFSLDIESEVVAPWMSSQGDCVRFPYPCLHMAVGYIASEEVVLGLTERYRLYVNGLEISSVCTSFALHNDFLLLTTLSHTVHCIPRSTKLSDLPKFSDGKTHSLDESIRRAERGSSIVTVVADDTKLILQMPRGNLETIHPRALALKTFQKLMDSNHLLEAFMMLRKHRINMNLLYDHNPDFFMANVDEFIHQIQSVSHFNLFITDLIEEDVTRTMYTASYQRPTTFEGILNKNTESHYKVDTVCDAMLAAFKRLGEDRYLLPILTAHVKKTKPELEQALSLVWSLHGKKVKENEPSALEALKYLLFLVDVNALYDVALGTYNFDLVMMVAVQSQKDPKEYIPFLNQMRRLEENYRKFSIDLHLKKYSTALEHISKCGDEHFEEAVRLISEQKLHLKALSLYKAKPTQHKHLASLYGNYLKTKNRNDEAGIMFAKAEEWDAALDCFRAAHDWRQVFCIASKLNYSENQLLELAKKVAAEMKERQRHLESAKIYEEYAQDQEEAIAVLIEGGQWSEALRLMHRYKRLDLIETHLLDALKDSAHQQMEFLTGQKEQFERHLNRLVVVRMEKEKARLDFLEGAADGHDAEADLFSDTSSITGASVTSHRTADSSRSTVFSKATGSSRSRRKAENKKWSLKEGSANEEFALIDALAIVITCVDGVREEINLLLKALIEFSFDERACSLQNFYSEFLVIIQSSLDKIWIKEDSAADMNNLGPGTTANAIAQAMQRGQAVQQTAANKEPVLLLPPKLNKDFRWKLHIAGDLDR